MKQIFFISGLLVASLCFSCSHNNTSTGSLTVSESDHEYKIMADYLEQNTEKVEHYMNEKIGNKNHISFTHTVIDAELTLDDGTKIYVVNKPGTLKVNLDKDQNARSSYEEIKSLGEGLKSFLNEQKQQ